MAAMLSPKKESSGSVAMLAMVSGLAEPNPTAKSVTSSPPSCALALSTVACAMASASPRPSSLMALEHELAPAYRPPSSMVHVPVAPSSERTQVCSPSVRSSMMRFGAAPVTGSRRVLPLTSSSRPSAIPLEMDVHPLARCASASGPIRLYARIVWFVSTQLGYAARQSASSSHSSSPASSAVASCVSPDTITRAGPSKSTTPNCAAPSPSLKAPTISRAK
jgi:hypothetical protein